MDYQPPQTLEEILAELEMVGVVRRNGVVRRGRQVFVVTEFGRKLHDMYPGEAQFSATVENLARQKLQGGQ